jgi:hypothetical protein
MPTSGLAGAIVVSVSRVDLTFFHTHTRPVNAAQQGIVPSVRAFASAKPTSALKIRKGSINVRGGQMELQDEAAWLRHSIGRMRAGLRFATGSQVESIIREFIGEAEDRLLALEHPDAEPPKISNSRAP